MSAKKNRLFPLGGLLVAPAVMLVFLYPNTAAAAVEADHLVISEIQTALAGAGNSKMDFIEIYNPTDADIDLDGYRLVKRTKTGTSDSNIKVWNTSTIVPARSYYLWTNTEYTSVTGDATSTDIISDNNAVALRLGAADTGAIIDAVAWGQNTSGLAEGSVYPDNIPDGSSLERIQDTDDNSLDFTIQSSPTPRNLASGSDPAPQADETEDNPVTNPSPKEPAELEPTVYITEVMPNPLGSDRGAEWIELYNDSDFAADVSGWFLDDAGAFLPSENAYELPQAIIGPKQYMAFLLPSGSITLNNDGDSIRLFNASQSFLEQVSYNNSGREGESYIKNILNQWEWSDSPTPNAANVPAAQLSVELRAEKETEPEAKDKYKGVMVEFNEIMGNAKGADAGNEWVELINLSDNEVDLTGWHLDDSEDKLSKKNYRFPSGSVIGSKGLLVIKLASQISITNTGEILSLFSPDKTLRVQVIIPEFPEEDYTFARLPETSRWDFSAIPTPAGENEFASASRHVEFSEIFIGKSDKEGFVEIVNLEKEWLDLSGWKLARGDSFYTFPKGASIPAESHLAIPLSQIRFAVSLDNLNQLKLLRPDGEVQTSLEDVVFPSQVSEKQSLAIEQRQATATLKPTPYQPNEIISEQVAPETVVVNTRTLPGKRAEVISAIEESRTPSDGLVAGKSIVEEDAVLISEDEPPIIIEKNRKGFFAKIKGFFCSFRFFGVKCR